MQQMKLAMSDLLAAAIAGAIGGIASAVIGMLESGFDLRTFIGLVVIGVPAGIACALLVAYPIYLFVPLRARESWIACGILPPMVFMFIGILLMSGYSELNFEGHRLVHQGHIVWTQLPWLFIAQYDIGISAAIGGIGFYWLRSRLVQTRIA